MRFKKLALAVCMMTLSAVLLTGCGSESSKSKGEDGKFKLDLATAYSADSPAGKAMKKFVDDVKTKSNGTIEINLFTDGTLGNPKDNYSSVASGDLDMTMAGLEGLDLYAPEYTFLDAPFLMKSLKQQEAILNSGIGDKLKAIYKKNGFTTLGFHNRDVRELAGTRPLKTLDDLKGLKLRLPGMRVYVDTWSQLGVSSTTVAMNELYTALQTKVAEACEGGYEQMATLKLYEVQPYIMETDHVYEFVGLYINNKVFDKMTPEQKKILEECAKEDLKYADQLAAESREQYKEQCVSKGVQIVQVDRNAFRKALEDYYKEQFKSKWNVTTYEEVMKYAN
ncbi:TRAP transporter substrate-binding protein [Acidaminococcus timonensis]|uniref:TRAP transporter substrate-binding protein n=1 Tax=Acidaminococcus timonensis TaxID=1871002 RepID=UPI0026F37C20|nr:TRAP transporter substrate-binding protein [Acidaminococcus timonensis]